MNETGTRLKTIRRYFRLNQTEFAKKMGLRQSTWSAIEKGTLPLSERNITLLALSYKVSREFLLEGKEPMFKETGEGEWNFDPLLKPSTLKIDIGPLDDIDIDGLKQLVAAYKDLLPINQQAVMQYANIMLLAQKNTKEALKSDED